MPSRQTGHHGDIAQLGERLPSPQEASGSIPLISTIVIQVTSYLTARKDEKSCMAPTMQGAYTLL